MLNLVNRSYTRLTAWEVIVAGLRVIRSDLETQRNDGFLLLPGPHIHVLIPEALIPSLSLDSTEWSRGRDRILSTCLAWQILITVHVLRMEFHTEEVDPLTPPVLFLLSGYTCLSPPLIFCHLLSSTISSVEQFSPQTQLSHMKYPSFSIANSFTPKQTVQLRGLWG